jgi:MFS transporter, ACS family, hexuronate transporter
MSGDSQRSSGFKWAVLGISWMAYMSAYLVRTAVAPLSPFLIEGLSLSKFEVGLLVSASALGYMAFQLPAGWLVDRVGVRRMLLVGPFVAGVFAAGMFFASGFTVALAVMVLAGFGCGCFPTVATKAVLHWFPLQERATAIGINQTSLNVAGVLTASLLPTLALMFGWKVAFVPIALIPIAASLVAYTLYKEPVGAEAKLANGGGASWEAVKSVVLDRNILLVALACMGLCVCEFAFTGYLVVYLKDVVGVSVTIAGGYLALANLGGAIGKPFFGALSDRVFRGSRRKPLLIVGVLILMLTVAMQMVTASTPSWLLIGVIVLFGFTAIGWGGMNLVLASEFAGKQNAGLAVGYAATISLIGNLLGPPIFGWMADMSGSYSMSWWLMTASAISAIVLLFFIQESKRKAG